MPFQGRGHAKGGWKRSDRPADGFGKFPADASSGIRGHRHRKVHVLAEPVEISLDLGQAGFTFEDSLLGGRYARARASSGFHTLPRGSRGGTR